MRVGLAFKAWIVGLLVAGLVVVPVILSLNQSSGQIPGGAIWPDRASLLFLIPASLVASFSIGSILSAPLFAIAFVLAWLLRDWPGRHPILTTLASIAITAILVALFDALTRNNAWAEANDFLTRFGHLVRSGETMLFALPVGVGTAYYSLGLRRLQAKAP